MKIKIFNIIKDNFLRFVFFFVLFFFFLICAVNGLLFSSILAEKNIWKKIGEYELKKGNYKAAFKYGGQVGGCDGKYMQARAVASSVGDCASNKVNRTALYSYALDLADEAGSCASSSWKSGLIGQLSTKSELFADGIKVGDSVDVSCWGVKVKIRAQ